MTLGTCEQCRLLGNFFRLLVAFHQCILIMILFIIEEVTMSGMLQPDWSLGEQKNLMTLLDLIRKILCECNGVYPD